MSPFENMAEKGGGVLIHLNALIYKLVKCEKIKQVFQLLEKQRPYENNILFNTV